MTPKGMELALRKAKPRGRYWVWLYSVGNPDFGQYAPVSEPELRWAGTLAALRDRFRGYKAENDLGGGNCPGMIVGEGRTIIGYFSYNERLWEGLPGKWDAAVRELAIDDAEVVYG